MIRIDIASNFLETLRAKIKHASYRVRGRKGNFNKIYKEGGFSGCEFAPSGAGSTLEQTKKIREEIPRLLIELGRLNHSSTHRAAISHGCVRLIWAIFLISGPIS